MSDQPVAVTKQYAIYVGLTTDMIADARKQLKESDCYETEEVIVQFNNQAQKFTFERFLKRLGFKIPKE